MAAAPSSGRNVQGMTWTCNIVPRKERALRFARILRISPKFALTACLGAMLLAAAGCGATGNLANGCLNPGELGRFKKEPLMMPIVSSLDTGVEEPNDQFAQA